MSPTNAIKLVNQSKILNETLLTQVHIQMRLSDFNNHSELHFSITEELAEVHLSKIDLEKVWRFLFFFIKAFCCNVTPI